MLTGAMLLLLAVLLPALSLVLTDFSKTWELVSIVQGSVTAFAILAGGFFVAYKLEVFRDFAPHLTITHAITHRAVSDSYGHISVSVTRHNGSRVTVDSENSSRNAGESWARRIPFVRNSPPR